MSIYEFTADELEAAMFQPTHATRSGRFWDRVDQSGGPDACWPWMRSRIGRGYGQLFHDGKLALAHRVAWTLTHGPISSRALDRRDRLCVLHSCDNPSCCNPAHLRLGTHADNMADKSRRGRASNGGTTCGYLLTVEQVLAVRQRYAAGDTSYPELARQFGVSEATIWRAVRRRRIDA